MRRIHNDEPAMTCKRRAGETPRATLQEDVAALIQSLQARANKMNKKRRTRNDRAHWMARGRQQVLRRVAVRLLAIEITYVATYVLYLALQEYLACLDKCCIDVEEERHAVGPRNGLPIVRWKAEGKAQELPKIIHALSCIVESHQPASVCHTLSLDGKRLVPLHCGSATPVPAIGPFPVLPDGIDESQQASLLSLEDALSHHTRVLVNAEHGAGEAMMNLLLMFLDRVLQYTSFERILVLAGSVHLLTHLRQCYRTWVSLEDGVPLSERYAAQYKPTVPFAPDTRICFSSVREMQLMIRSLQDAVLYRQTYDLIVVYDLASFTAPWQQVLAYLDASYYVGFGSPSDPAVEDLFDHRVIASKDCFQVYNSADHSYAHPHVLTSFPD